MQNIDLTSYWDDGIMPYPVLYAYTVSVNNNGYRVLTRDSTYDIAGEYIDLSSINYEWSIGDTFKPGSVARAHLKLRVLPGCPGLVGLTAVPSPSSVSDYSRAYQLRIVYAPRAGGIIQSVQTGGTLICTGMSLGYSGDSTELTFDDESVILENRQYDLGALYYNGLQTVVRNIFLTNGFNSYNGVSDVVDGHLYYQSDPMSAKQALSHILEANGMICYQLGGDFYLKGLLPYPVATAGEIAAAYSRDYSCDDFQGNYNDLLIYASDESTKPSGNFPRRYIVKGNPIIVAGNRAEFRTVLTNRVLGGEYRRGFEIEVLTCPQVVVGDYLKINYKQAANVFNSKIMCVSRFNWNGGAFCKLKEAEFDPVGRCS